MGLSGRSDVLISLISLVSVRAALCKCFGLGNILVCFFSTSSLNHECKWHRKLRFVKCFSKSVAKLTRTCTHRLEWKMPTCPSAFREIQAGKRTSCRSHPADGELCRVLLYFWSKFQPCDNHAGTQLSLTWEGFGGHLQSYSPRQSNDTKYINK